MRYTHSFQTGPNLSTATEHRKIKDSIFLKIPFPSNESSDNESENDEKNDDDLVIPSTSHTTPLKWEQKGSDHSETNCSTNPIKFG